MNVYPETAFSNDMQRAAACRVLCEAASLPGMWVDAYGPTEHAVKTFESSCIGLSAGQKVSFLAAWSIWDGRKPPRRPCALTLREILETLDGRYLLPLATFLVAVAEGREAVERWIAKNDIGPMPRL